MGIFSIYSQLKLRVGSCKHSIKDYFNRRNWFCNILLLCPNASMYLTVEPKPATNLREEKWPFSMFHKKEEFQYRQKGEKNPLVHIVLTCLCFCWNLPGCFVPLDGPDVDSVENSRPQASQHVRGPVRPNRDFLTRALRRGVGKDVAINFCLGWIPWHSEAGFCFISG